MFSLCSLTHAHTHTSGRASFVVFSPHCTPTNTQAVEELLCWAPAEQLDVLAALDAPHAARILAAAPAEVRQRLLAGLPPHIAANIVSVSARGGARGNDGAGGAGVVANTSPN